MDTLYPELRNYIYKFCEKWMTEDEVMATKTVISLPKATTEERRAFIMERGGLSEKPEVIAMVAEGYDALKERIVNRLWTEHRDELPINLCPVCKKLARSPLARQCRYCYHDWH